jgi:hypothetical protein
VKYERKKYRVQAIQNKGAYMRLAEEQRPVRTDKVEPVRWRKGICALWTL